MAETVNDLLLRVCRREPVERTPVWIMRQAGRYLPEYRALREKVDFVTLCKTPELAAKATLQPIERFGMDAAILFSDILVLAEPLGFEIAFNPGPEVTPQVRSGADVDRVRAADPQERLSFVYDAIRMLRRELAGRAPLIGFAAAPFTLAAYLVEGSGSKLFPRLKSMMYGEPSTAHRLLEKLAAATAGHLQAQVAAGAQAIQLFDTWAGLLTPDDYRDFGLRYARMVIDKLRASGAPTIYFAFNAGHLLEEVRHCGSDVVGLDWRTPLDRASKALGDRFVLQGNLDPTVLLSTPATIERRVAEVLEQAADIPGHIFNLGHGVLPETPVENMRALVEAVKNHRRGAG
jgi:uroporphyrinogen decarboxylase